MKDKELLNNELAMLTNKLKGQVVYRGNPQASGLPAFTKTIQRGRKYETMEITKAEFDAAGKDLANQSYAIPPLSSELAATAAHNVATWMPEAQWEALVDAILDDEPPHGADERTVEYMQSLPRRALRRFIGEVDKAREEAENRAKGTTLVTHVVIEVDSDATEAMSSSVEGDSDTSSDSLLAQKKARDEAVAKAIWEHDHLPNW